MIWRALGALVALSVPCTFAAEPDKAASGGKVLQSSSQNQRFVFDQISEYRRDQYMLDTQTGRLWVMAKRMPKKRSGEISAADEGFMVLDPVPYASMIDDRVSTTPIQEK